MFLTNAHTPTSPVPPLQEGNGHPGPTTTAIGGMGHPFAPPTLSFFYIFRALYDVAELNIALIRYI